MKKQPFLGALLRLVSGQNLSRGFYKFLLVHICFMIFTRLPGVFINTLLLGQSDDINIVLFYNLTYFIADALSMIVAAQVLHRTNSSVTAVIGIICYNVLFFTVILLNENASHYYILLGMLIGLADGFYWVSYGTLLSDSTNFNNRDSGLAIISLGVSLVNMIVPLVSGFLISCIGGIKGYLTVFAIALVISLITSVLAFRLPKKQKDKRESVQYRKTLNIIWRQKELFFSLLGQGCKGIREGAFSFILSLVLFQLVKSELLIGVNSFLTAILSIISFMILSRILTVNNRKRYMLRSVIILSVAAGLSAITTNPILIIVYSCINALFCGFLENSCYATFLDAIQKVPQIEQIKPEIFAVNETVLIVGRIIGLGIMVAMNFIFGVSVRIQLLSLLILTITQLSTVFFSGKAIQLLNISEINSKKQAV